MHKKYKKNIFTNSLQNLKFFLIFLVDLFMFSFSDQSDFVFHKENMKILLMVYGMVNLKSLYSTHQKEILFLVIIIKKVELYVESKMKRFLKIGRAFSRIVLFLGRRDLSWGYCKMHSGLCIYYKTIAINYVNCTINSKVKRNMVFFETLNCTFLKDFCPLCTK